ncbi:MAG: outer membrane protein assembly factor BamA [Rhizobacter sp.]|nr:outer membrane protein assembly factor BamA [Rhizobacter sp.]MBP6268985.1 outer membrane protein assembly factor BamA [Rhizobacter sp.]
MRPTLRFPSSLTSFRPSLICLALATALQAGSAWAVEPFKLVDIRVEGLQRSDAGTVFASLPFRIGDTYTDEKGVAALRALFATGLFKDVRIQIDGSVVVVIVDERSVIGSIDFVGAKEFEKDALVKALKDFGVGEGQPFDKALADRAEQELKRQYLSRSLYGVEVVTTVTPMERNRVNVTFNISEGSAAKIKELRILGNTAFSESSLKDLLELNDGGWLTWYTKANRYSRAKLNADLETLRAYYLNRGYLEFNVESTQVAISPDKQDITITINVNEGQAYTVTSVKLEGEYLSKEDDFKSLVTIKPGEPYRAEAVAETTKAFTERFGTFGYAFARIEARPEIDRVNGRVDLTLVANPQRRVYVRRISVAGNARTRDEVVRREFRQFESSWYDGNRIKLSRDRVDRLGYFSDVNIDTNEVPGTSDQVDLILTIKEKPTGNLLLGAGFSSADKISLTASVKQENVFGTGNYLGLEFNTSKSQRTIVLSTIDPYFTVDGISRAFDLYYRTSSPLNSQGEDYKLVTPGGSVRFGVPFSEYDTVFFGIGYERTEIQGTNNLPDSYFRYREQFGSTSSSVPLTIGWTRDQRDSALVPTRGRFQRVNVDLGLLGDQRYMRANLQFQEYFNPFQRVTLGLNAEFGYGKGLGGRPYPIFKNFFGGGLGTVRGFDQGSLGGVDNLGAYLGGNRRLNINGELYLPLPGTGNDRTLRWFAYTDVGNVWAVSDKMTVDSLRASVGLGVSWVSPVGPLKVSYGTPIKKEPTDRIQRLQFQLGTAF